MYPGLQQVSWIPQQGTKGVRVFTVNELFAWLGFKEVPTITLFAACKALRTVFHYILYPIIYFYHF